MEERQRQRETQPQRLEGGPGVWPGDTGLWQLQRSSGGMFGRAARRCAG
jgi:hypothetical protein